MCYFLLHIDILSNMDYAVFFYHRVIYTQLGLKVEYDLSQPPGNRVKRLVVRCRDCGNDTAYFPVKLYKTYIIGMPTFLRDGRDGFYDHYDETDPEVDQGKLFLPL